MTTNCPEPSYGLDDRVAVERVGGRERRSLWQIAWRVPLRDDDLAAFGHEPRRGRASNRAVAENCNSVGHGRLHLAIRLAAVRADRHEIPKNES